MPIDLACPSCRKMLQVPDYAAGKKARCPSCGEIIPVPARERTVDPYVAPKSPAKPSAEDVEYTQAAGRLDIGRVWSESWATWSRHLGTFVGATAIVIGMTLGAVMAMWALMFLGMAVAVSTGDGETADMVAGSISMLISLVGGLMIGLFTCYLAIGMTRMALDAGRGLPVRISRLFSGSDVLVGYFGYYLLFTILVEIGLIFCIVPGVWMACAWWPGFLLIADRRCGGGEALGYAARLTRGNILSGFVLLLLVGLVHMVGVLTLCIGSLFTTPLIFVLFATAYRQLAGDPKPSEASAVVDPMGGAENLDFA